MLDHFSIAHAPATLSSMPRILRTLLLSICCLLCVLAALVYTLTWHPGARESAPVSCPASAPMLQPGQALKVMTWNVQYLAGKRHVFWYDLPGGDGPDELRQGADIGLGKKRAGRERGIDFGPAFDPRQDRDAIADCRRHLRLLAEQPSLAGDQPEGQRERERNADERTVRDERTSNGVMPARPH